MKYEVINEQINLGMCSLLICLFNFMFIVSVLLQGESLVMGQIVTVYSEGKNKNILLDNNGYEIAPF